MRSAVIAAIVAAVVAAASSTAATMVVTSKNIKNGTIQTVDLSAKAKRALKGNRGLRGPRGLVGAQGPAGSPGAEGPRGATGVQGPAGSPDTPQQVLDKAKQADGTGSGLEADLLDGVDSSGFLGATAKATDADNLDGHDSAEFVRVIDSTIRTVDYPAISAHTCVTDSVIADNAAVGDRVELGTPITPFTNLISVGAVVRDTGLNFSAMFQICNLGDAPVDPPNTSFEVLAVRP